ncbi:Outer membrane protein A precursor [hydrothermal vent metagenome]|uniref:Outer membrane protein A n=1 Tax=hydrothermal vent metagenome TaxID=652676 RepID=A0A1W1C0R4_9ZZZZ
MKRLLLLPALLFGTASFAADSNYEISPMLGYNLAEGNIGIKGDDHFLGGLELQRNYKNSKISPEISVLYSPSADYEDGGDTSITRFLFNGVYSFSKNAKMTPFVKAGLGIENVGNEIQKYNETGLVVDAGAGIKVPFTKALALKAEALYLAKVSDAHNKSADNNLIAMVGLTYSFGAEAKKAPKEVVEEKVVAQPELTPVVVVALVEKDSDGDGVYDKLDKCPNTPANSTVSVDGCPISMDDDHDGVSNAKDKCPNTALGTKVDTNGCDIDADKDGVLNVNDICPDTPIGEAVNSDGCPAKVNLQINFGNNSAAILSSSYAELDKYADFLKKYTNYSAKIIGYTDSRGSASYNKKLSLKRARAVMQALVQRGVNPSHLSAIGMGEANPVADNATAEGRAQNRRIEAKLTRN